MKGTPITIRLDLDLRLILDAECRRAGQSRSRIIREALKRHLLRRCFEDLRRRAMPFAAARGYLTDEDVFKTVS